MENERDIYVLLCFTCKAVLTFKINLLSKRWIKVRLHIHIYSRRKLICHTLKRPKKLIIEDFML